MDKQSANLFKQIVKESKTIREVLKKLGIKPIGGNYKSFYSKASKLGIDVSHFKSIQNQKDIRKQLSTDAITDSIINNTSLQSTLKSLGLKRDCGSNVRWLKYFLKCNNINTDHWLGQGHGKGVFALIKHINKIKKPLSEILIKDSYHSSSRLKQRLIKENIIINQCSICNIESWQNKPLSLHLDHINGINTDNRLENLRLLCPNCHSQTITYCGRNKQSFSKQ